MTGDVSLQYRLLDTLPRRPCECQHTENSGNGEFTRHIIGRNQGSYDIRAVDMDGDKDLDLLIAGHTSKNIVWLENPFSE